MYSHTQRWKDAQKIEVEYWTKEYFRDSEFKELINKYSGLFAYIEKKYAFDENTKILDLGCGATCPSILFKKGVKYGVDPIVDVFLESDKEKLANKIALSKGSGEAIPFEDDYFDVILCRNALDHMDNLENVMEEIKRVVKGGGIVILSVYTYTRFVTSLKRASEHIPFLRNIEHPHTFTPGEFRDFCTRYFEPQEEKIVFEGTSSVDYGKEDVELTEPLLHKIVALLNKYVFMNNWFLREYLLICKNT